MTARSTSRRWPTRIGVHWPVSSPGSKRGQIAQATMAALSASAGEHREDADPRCHRHRRLGQIFVGDEVIRRFRLDSDRFQNCGSRHRPVEAQKWRCASGRPHPHETRSTHRKSTCARSRPAKSDSEVPKFVPHPPKPAAPRASISSLSRLPASAGQHRHCRSCRHLALRHDAGIRRCVPARKNRHARFCRSGGDQQIRSQGRRRRAARRSQAGSAQSESIYAIADTLPVYGAIAARFQDDGVTGLYLACGIFWWRRASIRRPAGSIAKAACAVDTAADRAIVAPALSGRDSPQRFATITKSLQPRQPSLAKSSS